MPCQSRKISTVTFAFAWPCWIFMGICNDSDFHMDGWESWSATFHDLQGCFGAILGINKITKNSHAGITWFLYHHSWYTVLVEVIHHWIQTIVQQLQTNIPKFSARVCIMQWFLKYITCTHLTISSFCRMYHDLVYHQPHTTKVQVWSQACPYGIWGGQSGIGTEFSPSTSVFLPYNSTSSLYSFICQWQHIIPTIDTIIIQQQSSFCNVAETTSGGLSSRLMVLEYGMKFKLGHFFFHCTLSWENLMLTPCSGQSIFLLDHQTLCSPLKPVMLTSLLAQLTVLLWAGSMHDMHK